MMEEKIVENSAASNILTDMMQKGEIIQDDEGRISVAKDPSPSKYHN